MRVFASTTLFTAAVSGAAVLTSNVIEQQLAARQLPGLTGPMAAMAASLVGTPIMTNLLSGMGFKPASAAKIVDEKPLVRPDAKRKLIRYGPVTLPAFKGDASKGHGHAPADPKAAGGMMSSMMGMLGGGAGGMDLSQFPLTALTGTMDPDGVAVMQQLTDGIPGDATYLAARTSIVYEDGTPARLADGVYLHHAIALDLNSMLDTKIDNGFVSFCPGKLTDPGMPKKMNLPVVFGGAVDPFTQWYTSMDGKLNSGYYLGKKNSLIVQGEMVNYSPKEQKVYVQYDVEYMPGKVGDHATQTFLTATGCDLSKMAFKPTAANGSITSEGYPVYKDGYIISSRGHVHDGGTSVSLMINDKLICTSNAIYGGKEGTITVEGKQWETISKMTDCVTDPVAVKKGDMIKISSTYDTLSHPLRESDGEAQEEMAIMYFDFVPGNPGKVA